MKFSSTGLCLKQRKLVDLKAAKIQRNYIPGVSTGGGGPGEAEGSAYGTLHTPQHLSQPSGE